jgi:glycosyltransferase involved in cell wall biosynthesis
MKISLIQPGRNNLKYLKWSYDSIRKNQGNHEVQICVADDASTDGTWGWCRQMMETDLNFQAIRNETGKRLGHTILYDTLVNEVAKHDICMIYHADMYLCPGALDSIEKHMYGTPEEPIVESRIVSLTRIEPPLHPPGPEKILEDFGIEPEEFNEDSLLQYVKERVDQFDSHPTTEGIFAPWAFWKEDFQALGGHDPIFAPQSKEDTDIFNRFQLNGVEFIQTWEGFVYHMTCRGSRFADGAKRNPDGEVFMKNRETKEWLKQNQRSTREFIRKWGHFYKHDEFLKPIIPPKYDIGFIIKNCNIKLLEALEPWCSTIYMDNWASRHEYLYQENSKTSYNLGDKIRNIDNYDRKKENNILVTIDGNNFNQQDFSYIQQLSEILNDSGEPGFHDLGNLVVTISKLTTFEKELIFITNSNNEEN